MIDDRLINEVTQEDDRTKIYKIDASGRKITAISGLRAYERLRCLVLDFNLISTIDGLNALADLRELHLEGNSLSKISQLEGNKALQVLNLKRNCIEVATK